MGSLQLHPLGSHHELHGLFTSGHILRHMENLPPKVLGTLKVWNSGAMKSFCLGYCFSCFTKCDLTTFLQLFENDKETPFKYQSHSKMGHLY